MTSEKTSLKYGGFRVICPECGGDNVEVDSFLVESQITYSRHTSMIMFFCGDCDIEWNPKLTAPVHV